jgi:DNA-binding transcriptional LysR family regulator
LYVWEFERNRRELKVRVDGQLVFNDTDLVLQAAIEGSGLGYLPEDKVQAKLSKGELIRVLSDWCPPFTGYHLYYPSRTTHARICPRRQRIALPSLRRGFFNLGDPRRHPPSFARGPAPLHGRGED